jgi:16S rRNA (uracil1498-N3)-methyltransferase
MKEVRFFYVPDVRQSTALPDEEAVHAVRVLRMVAGDELMLMDGNGTFYRAVVTLAHGHHCQFDILETLPQQRPWQGYVHLAMAPTKMMDRTEWMVEKATEIGIDELSFLDCRFSERKVLKTERIDKIIVAAMKQSRKAWKPVLNALTPFADFVTTPRQGKMFIAHCYDEIAKVNLYDELRQLAPDEPTTVLIGPEGDFSIDEVRMAVDAGWVSVDLGKSRLRTETACLSAVMMMQLAKQ